MDTHLYEFQVRALVYREDGRFYARALEMDLVGTGASESEALRELIQLIQHHISFAVFKKDDGLILHRAEPEYFDRWERAHQGMLKRELFPDRSLSMDAKGVFIRFTKEELQKLKKTHRFSHMPEPALA